MSAAPKVPPRDKQGMRTGFTTGACAAAAAKAAVRLLVRNEMLTQIETRLPNRERVTFVLERCERRGETAICSIIKDAGDDPDCTHGAEIVAEAELRNVPGVVIAGGQGVATVTKPGLGLDVGTAAINPVPRRNITEMVEEELSGSGFEGASITIHVPRGEEMARETTNARLGLLGGISILGTTGIVRPYSTAAYKASVVQAIDVASSRGNEVFVLTTGGKSESYAMALHPDLPEDVFIQVGDFIGVGLRRCAHRKARRIHIVGMMGKLSKMADGRMQTHAAGSDVNMELLARLARAEGASEALCASILEATTARRVLELCAEAGLRQITSAICREVVRQTEKHIGGAVPVVVELVDFGGASLARHPEREGGQQR